MRYTTLAASFLLVLTMTACGVSINIDVDDDADVSGSGTIITETRTVADFEEITLTGEGTVLVTAGTEASLSIEADDNLMQYLESTVRSGTLEISTESGVDIDPSSTIIYRVTAPEITGLTLTGAGAFQMAESRNDSFSIKLTGAGDIEVGDLQADELTVEITGVGEVELSGKVTSQDVTLPGAGSYQAGGLESATARITSSGVGSATVWVTDELDASLTGVGSISYFGTPRVSQTVTGIGTIKSLGDA